MHYEGNLIRPPSEAHSILLQVTVGCSHHKCTFCSSNEQGLFKIKPDSVIVDDIAFAAAYCKRLNRVFLCDRDALIVPQERLVAILQEIRRQLPWVTRVGTYANAKSLNLKTSQQLSILKENGLGIIYMGLESGDDITLEKVKKGADSDRMIRMGQKAKAVGLKLSLTVLLGIAGKDRSDIHARETGQVLSAINPDYVGALSLMLIPGTPLYRDYEIGRFQLLNAAEMLRELRTMIAHTDLSGGLFHANHASNYLPIRAKFPQDKPKTLHLIDHALSGNVALRPEWMRAL
jgi:radical SAM superfamily enzyme YgiQ (UPF0313 family)